MSALSFQGEWLKPLLFGFKQQTTRPQTDRIKVGAVCHIYNQQRRRIADKPEMRLTGAGIETMVARYGMTKRQKLLNVFHAHFLGKVIITEVYDMLLPHNSHRNAWARADGFDNFTCADTWFTDQYGDGWVDMWWTVIRWDGWLEQYFEPRAI